MHRYVELKKSLPVSFLRELRGYLTSIYANAGENAFDAELGELDKLRHECTNPTMAPSFISTLSKYYCQLVDLENRVNIDAADLKVPFAWYNCSAGDDKKILVSSHNLRFERAAVLFNIAAVNIQLAGMESFTSAEGLKRACNFYMTAAGIFQFIADTLTSSFDVPTPSDLSPPSLRFLVKFSLASAQECFVLKGVLEKSIKDAMLAKLALATGQLYDGAAELGEGLGIGSIYGRVLGAYLTGRATYYKALGRVRKAADCLSSGKYGEEIAFLNEATTLLNRCKETKRFMDTPTCTDLDSLAGQVVRSLERAIKDNSVIYHETVPNASTLPDIGQAIVARPTAFSEPKIEEFGRPILARLVPEAIRQHAQLYYAKRNERFEALYARLRQLRIKQDAIMMEQNLPGILNTSAQVLGLPEGLLSKADEVRSSGGGEALMQSLSVIETLRADTDAILKQVKQMLADEAAVDEEAVNEFGASQWTRPRSATLNQSLLQALESYRASYSTAQQSDSQLQKQLDDAIVGITALGSSQAELEASIPASSATSTSRGDARLADKVRAILQETEGFDELRSGTVAEVQAFCVGDVVEEEFKGALEGAEESRVLEFVSERVERIVAPFESSLGEVEAYQLARLEELRSAARAFASSFASESNCLQERHVALQTLENAYRTFQTLSAHISEAMRFYSGLLGLAERLRENARDFVVSRELEMKELKTTLLEKISSAADAAIASRVGGDGYGGGFGNGSAGYGNAGPSTGSTNFANGSTNFANGSTGYSGYGNQQPFYNQPSMQPMSTAYAGYAPQMPPQYAASPMPQQQQQWSPGMPVQYAGESSSGAGSSRSSAAGYSGYPGQGYQSQGFQGQGHQQYPGQSYQGQGYQEYPGQGLNQQQGQGYPNQLGQQQGQQGQLPPLQPQQHHQQQPPNFQFQPRY